MPGDNTQDSRALGAGLIIVGAALALSSIVIGIVAADHMAAVAAALCGPVTGHCLLCVVAAASLLSSTGVIVAGVALRQEPRLTPRRARRA